jgi:hypothetical protein
MEGAVGSKTPLRFVLTRSERNIGGKCASGPGGLGQQVWPRNFVALDNRERLVEGSENCVRMFVMALKY